MPRWVDVSVSLSPETVVWPDDPALRVRDLTTFDADAVRVSELQMSVHTGTHIDAPTHYLRDGSCIDEMPLDATVGPCIVLDLANAGQRIEASHLADFDIPPGERVLLRTQNSSRRLYGERTFASDFAHLGLSAAEYLAQRDVRCVGIDYLSVGGFDDGDAVHRVLLESGAWIIEGLDLRRTAPGAYELVCLPLKLVGLEGAPARAILRKMRTADTRDEVDDAVEWASLQG